MDPSSTLHSARPDILLLSLTAREFLAELSPATAHGTVAAALERAISEITSLWLAAKQNFGCQIIQQSFLNTAATLLGSLDRSTAGAPTQLIRELNSRLIMAARENDVLILDMERPLEEYGLRFWFDSGRWLQAKMEISPDASLLYGDLLGRLIGASYGLSRKCLVLDLDNTLWGGVVGDDGIENIVLGEGSGPGEAFLELQRYVRLQAERGIILAVCSKNEMHVAEQVFDEHPEMLLKRSDIAVFIANWQDKASNLRTIANELNIGLDSLVFVDDNPAERARVRQSLPMVAVPELPADPSGYVRCLAAAGYFEAAAFTADDAARNQQYAANAHRKAALQSSESLDDYLRSLEMTMTSGRFDDISLSRVTQLINKTNQFNVTTKRRTLDEIRDIAANQHNITMQVRLADRFGDNGIVSALVLCPGPDNDSAYTIDTWVMSCRVFGRGLEQAIMNLLVESTQARGIDLLVARYIQTEKNRVIENLYPSLGFTSAKTPDENSSETQSNWNLSLRDYKPHQTYIKLDND